MAQRPWANPPSPAVGPLDRSEAATTLLLWQVEGDPHLADALGKEHGSLLSLVESVSAVVPPRPRPAPPSPVSDFLHLREESAAEELRSRLRALAPFLPPEEREELEHRLESGLLPETRLATVLRDVERLEARYLKEHLTEDFGAWVVPPRPVLRAVLLFARDGRLLAGEGTAPVDPTTLAGLISRGEAGSTWSLVQKAVTLVGHLGARSALVAVFEGRPRADAGATLRLSVGSLEQRDRLTNALGRPGGHEALRAFVRAVRMLLDKNA